MTGHYQSDQPLLHTQLQKIHQALHILPMSMYSVQCTWTNHLINPEDLLLVVRRF